MSSRSFDLKESLAGFREMGKREIKLMEVCGTHTMAIAKAGIKKLLPEGISLLSGPGCPVCVTPTAAIDEILSLSSRPEVIIATYGDMVRVPGSTRGDNLAYRRALGASVSVVYSPLDAISLAGKNPDKEVVFLGVGFETTAPGTAAAIEVAKEAGVKNFSILSLLKTVPPALHKLISQEDFEVCGFFCPGHVATITGEEGFSFLASEYKLPCVIAGFSPEEIIKAICMLLRQIKSGSPRLENAYPQAVRAEGNPLARAMTEKYFEPEDALWRGFGEIEKSGLKIRDEYESFDAAKRFGLSFDKKEKESPCRCGEVICGRMRPQDCPLFGKVCTPDDPVGPCMVSGEGACAAAYKYSE